MRREDKSLLGVTVKGKYTQHPLLRGYAQEKLMENTGELRESQRWHARYFLALVEAAEPHLTGPEQALWTQRLEDEYDNLHVVFTWAAENNTDTGLRLGAALWRFWVVRGHSLGGYKWAMAATLLSQAELRFTKSDAYEACLLLQKSLRLRYEISDRHGVAESWEALARFLLSASPEQSVRLLAAAQSLRAYLQIPLPPRNQGEHETSVVALCTALGEKVFAKAWSEGQGVEAALVQRKFDIDVGLFH